MMQDHLDRAGVRAYPKALNDAGLALVRNIMFRTGARPHDIWAKYSTEAQKLKDEYPAYLEL